MLSPLSKVARRIADSSFDAGFHLWIDTPAGHAEWRKNGDPPRGIPFEMALRVESEMGEEHGHDIIYVGQGRLTNRYPKTIIVNGSMLNIEKVPKNQAERESGRRAGKWSEVDPHLKRLGNDDALQMDFDTKKDLNSLRSYVYQRFPQAFWIRSSQTADGVRAFIWRRESSPSSGGDGAA